MTTPPQLTSDTSGSASPPTVRSLTDLPSQHSQVSLLPIYLNNTHRSVTHQTTLTTFMGKSLTRQSSQHSQISHLAINPHNIHRSVSYPDVFSVATKLPMFKVLQHSQVSGPTINPLNIHRSVSYPYKIHGSLTDLPSQHSQASLFIVLTSLYTEVI